MKKNLIKEGKENFIEIFGRLKRRDFSGYTGLVVKNSTYQFATNVISKAGSLVFTIVIARLLMPELFGLYSLALSTILFFMAFGDLGLGTAALKFISEAMGKDNRKKAKSYFHYLVRIKFFLLIILAGVLAITAKFIAENYYQKPIFLALLGGSIYILFRGFISFIKPLFQSLNNFKVPLYLETFFQIARIIIVPLVVVVSLNYALSNQVLVSLIILSLALTWFLTLVFIILFFRKKLDFLNANSEKIKKQEQIKIKKFLIPLSVMSLSGLFFGYVDIVILGRFLPAEFIGQYRVAFSLIGAIAPLVVFSTVFLPIFSRIKGDRLKKAFKKSIKITLQLSFVVAIPVFIFSSLIIKIIFGEAYLIASPLLKILSIIILTYPVTNLYATYLFSKGKSKLVAKLLISTTAINIILNLLFIMWLIDYGNLAVVMGVSTATIISRVFYLTSLVIFARKEF